MIGFDDFFQALNADKSWNCSQYVVSMHNCITCAVFTFKLIKCSQEEKSGDIWAKTGGFSP